MTKERIAELREQQGKCLDMPCWVYGELLNEIERLQAEKGRLMAALYPAKPSEPLSTMAQNQRPPGVAARPTAENHGPPWAGTTPESITESV
jgi:hypothetical protein